MRLDGLTMKQKADFGEQLLTTLGPVPFGSFSKGELELAMFTALVDAGVIATSEPVFTLAKKLGCTPTRVNSLVFNWNLRSASDGADDLAKAVQIADVLPGSKPASDRIVLNVESRYWREALVAKLKELRVFTDTSFNRERVVLPLAAFENHIDALFGVSSEDLEKAIAAEKKAIGAKTRADALKSLVGKFAAGTASSAGKQLSSAAVPAALALPHVHAFLTSLT